MRGHIGANPAIVHPLGPPQQLNLLPRRLSVVHVRQRYPGDSLGGHLLRIDVPAKGDSGQNTDLPAGVIPFDVSGGVPLRVAVVLSLLQRRLEG